MAIFAYNQRLPRGEKTMTIATTPTNKARRSFVRTDAPIGRVGDVMTTKEHVDSIKRFGKVIRESEATAVAFLKSAGILNRSGNLAKPYRSN